MYKLLKKVATPIITILFLTASFAHAQEDEATYYLLTDHLGSVDVVLDEDGNVVERADYKPFGSDRLRVTEPDAPDTDYKFTGKELDGETGLHYYGARYYDSEIGRFVSEDSWEGDIKDPQTLNKYSYVVNNPLMFVDPSGNIPKDASLISKLSSIVSFNSYGEGDGWLAQGARQLKDNPTQQTWNEAVNRQTTAFKRFIANPSSFADETWDPISTERILTLDTNVQIPATDFINAVEAENNTTLGVTSAYRSIEEQNKIYAQGRTTPGNKVTWVKGGSSYHNYGLAIDVVKMDNGKAIWERADEQAVSIAKGLGFEWGGDWEGTPDYPHFQMTFGQSISKLLGGEKEKEKE